MHYRPMKVILWVYQAPDLQKLMIQCNLLILKVLVLLVLELIILLHHNALIQVQTFQSKLIVIFNKFQMSNMVQKQR